MTRTDDPDRDFLRWDAEQNEDVKCCDICGEPLYEYFYDVDGDIYCEECVKKHFRKVVEY